MAIRVFQARAVERKPLASQWYDMALGGAAVGGRQACWRCTSSTPAGGFYMPAPSTHLRSRQDPGPQPGHHRPRSAPPGRRRLPRAPPDSQHRLHDAARDRRGTRGMGNVPGGVALPARPRPGRSTARRGRGHQPGRLCAQHQGPRGHRDPRDRCRAAVQRCPGRTPAGRTGARPGGQVGLLVPLLLVVMLGYLVGLAGEISQPPAAAQNQQLTSWLAARHLHTGLSGYWESNVVTLTSGGRVQIRLVNAYGGRLVPSTFEGKAEWYDPHRNTANFVVLFPGVASIAALPRSRPCWRRSASPREPTTSVPTPSWSGIRICCANSARPGDVKKAKAALGDHQSDRDPNLCRPLNWANTVN